MAIQVPPGTFPAKSITVQKKVQLKRNGEREVFIGHYLYFGVTAVLVGVSPGALLSVSFFHFKNFPPCCSQCKILLFSGFMQESTIDGNISMPWL